MASAETLRPQTAFVRLYALLSTPLRLVDDGISVAAGISSEIDLAASWVVERLAYDDADVERVADEYLVDLVLPACRRVLEEAGAAGVSSFYMDTLRRALDALAPSLPRTAEPVEALRRALCVAAPHRHAALSEALVDAIVRA